MMVQKSLIMNKANKKVKAQGKNGVFERIVIGAVDNVFSSLGESCKQSIYFRLKNSFNISREEIPRRIDTFEDALEEMFGVGAKLIKIEIMKLAFSQVRTIKYPTKQDALLFTEYLKKLGNA